MNICFTDTVSTSTVDFSLILRQVISIAAKNSIDIISANHLKPAFTEGGKERENMSTMARSCAGVGSALVTNITMQCVYMLGKGNEYAGFKWFALIISILFFAAILIPALILGKNQQLMLKQYQLSRCSKTF